MKKKYRAGGQNPPQNKPTYGPPKPPGYKEPSKEEMKERQDEASYNKMRKELDRELASMKKRGATEDQINKYADKMISAWARNRWWSTEARHIQGEAETGKIWFV